MELIAKHKDKLLLGASCYNKMPQRKCRILFLNSERVTPELNLKTTLESFEWEKTFDMGINIDINGL